MSIIIMENKKYKIIPFVQNIFKRKIIIIQAELGNINDLKIN